ncbi:MAG: tetratricopeptide repeat protein [Terracidiphilus sp.]
MAATCVMVAVVFVHVAVVSAQGASGQVRPAQTGSPAFQGLAAKAMSAQDAGNLDLAVPLFHKALALNPRWDEGWWSLGEIDYGKNRYRGAAGEYRRALALDPKSGIAHIMLGLCEFELGQDSGALRDIEAGKDLGVEKDGQLQQVVFYHEGILLQRAGRFQAATEPLSSLCLSGVRSAGLAQIFGMTMLHIDSKTPPADNTPEDDVVQHIGRGACLSAANQYDQARHEYDYVLQHDPHFPLVHYAYGRFLLEARDAPGAIEAFKQEITEAPDSVLARLEIAATEYKLDSAAGIPYAREAVEIVPQSPLPHYFLGLLLLDTGDYQGSIPHLEIAKNAFPKDAKIYWSLGVAYAHVGRPKEAAEARLTFAQINQANAGAQNAASGDTPDSIPRVDVIDSPGAGVGH